MTFRHTALALIACAGFAALPSLAQNMKPGLWEINSKMKYGNSELGQMMEKMQKQFANMPPEQRKMMEDMMAKQGVSMTAGAGGGMLVKFCMTPEMAAQKQFPIDQSGNCKQTLSPMVGNTMKVAFSCTKPPSSGDGQVSFNGDSAYSMQMRANTTLNGKPETMSVDGQGRWLAPDCGNIKPMPLQAPASK